MLVDVFSNACGGQLKAEWRLGATYHMGLGFAMVLSRKVGRLARSVELEVRGNGRLGSHC
jgi:hypothetical protein